MDGADNVDWFELVRRSPVADDLHLVEYDRESRLFGEGDPGDHFLIVATGHVLVEAGRAGNSIEIARVGPGGLLGELALLTGAPRTNTVTALDRVTAFVGDRRVFAALLEIEPVRRHFALTAAERLAERARPVQLVLRDGRSVEIRPLLPQDRGAYLDALGRVSQETLRNRFFSAGRPSSSVIDYLLDIDYARHFAWVVSDPSNPEHPGVAVARYISGAETPPGEAEVALGIADEFQGQGLGTALMGALGVAAEGNGFARLSGEVLADNLAMRSVFDKAGAEWTTAEPGVVHTTVDVKRVVGLIDPGLAERLERSIHDMSIAASVALA